MTAHTGAKYENQFNTDFNHLKAAAEQYQADQKQAKTYANDYAEQWAHILMPTGKESPLSSNNPWTVLILLMALMANQGSNQLNETLATQGDQLQCQTDLGALNNAITNMTNDTEVTNGATNTDLPTPADQTGAATNLVRFTAKGLDKILNALKTTTAPWYKSLQSALGSSGASSLATNFSSLRDQFYLGDGSPYDPKAPTGDQKPSFAFDASSNGKYLNYCFNSFSELHRLAAMKGDPGGATTVLSNLSTALNTNTSMLQSTQASSNQLISQTTNTIKTLESAVSNFGHAMESVVQAANQNMSK